MSTYDFEPNPEDYGPEPAHIANGTHKKNLLVTPPKREWVGLTEEEYQQIQRDYFRADQWRGIEAKLKEKNATPEGH